MKSHKVLAPALAAVSFMVFACQAVTLQTFKPIRGSGKITSQDRPVSDFDQVSLDGIGNLTIVQGDEESLVVEADDNLMEYIVTEVRGRTLHIGIKESMELLPSQPIQYQLALKQIISLTTSGLGRVSAESLNSNELKIELSGAGDVGLGNLRVESFALNMSGLGNVSIGSLNGERLAVDMSGAGNCQVNGGQVDNQTIDISGAGSYLAPDLQSKVANLHTSGAGKIILWVTDALDVELSGIGNVEYYGTPTVTQEISGIGSVKGLGDKSQ